MFETVLVTDGAAGAQSPPRPQAPALQKRTSAASGRLKVHGPPKGAVGLKKLN